jgi:acyl carrier protein
LLRRILDTDAAITEDSALMDELGLSSSMALELLIELEDDLDIQIDVEQMEEDKVSTVGGLADYITEYSAPR